MIKVNFSVRTEDGLWREDHMNISHDEIKKAIEKHFFENLFHSYKEVGNLDQLDFKIDSLTLDRFGGFA